MSTTDDGPSSGAGPAGHGAVPEPAGRGPVLEPAESESMRRLRERTAELERGGAAGWRWIFE
ncbi:hypothetical protein [Kitasatospora sp. NPDC058046]|uniref:hypothetical protein n=1 Tax=Kitasatospora sp. NPDC058046 TaxID=3346312 RepID=UPI0036DF86C1